MFPPLSFKDTLHLTLGRQVPSSPLCFPPPILQRCFSLTSTIWIYFTEHESNSVSQEEYKKEQMNLQKMFLSLDLKRKVALKFSFRRQ